MLKRDYKSNLEHVRKYAATLLPNVTLIMNVEFQTMRKFYYYCSDSFINQLQTNDNNEITNRLFKIIDNRKIFLDYLTTKTVVFKKNDVEVADWWNRLTKLKIKSNICDDLLKEYTRNLEIDKIKSKIKGDIATLNMYLNRDNTSLNDDLSAVLCCLNDNDIENLRFTNIETGEVVELLDNNYMYIKEKKKKSLNSLIKKLNKNS